MPYGGLGTLLGYAAVLGTGGQPTAYACIGNVLKVGPAVTKAKDINYVPLVNPTDPANVHAQHLPASDDTGPATFNLPYNPAVRAALAAIERVAKQFILVHPSGNAQQFPGLVSEIGEEEIDADRLLTTAAGIMVTDKPTLLPVTPKLKTITTTVTLSGGAGSLDLTALPGTIDGTGLNVRRIIVTAPAHAVTVFDGGGSTSNDYHWATAAASAMTVAAGTVGVIDGPTSSHAISSTNKIVRLTGTGIEVVNITLLLDETDVQAAGTLFSPDATGTYQPIGGSAGYVLYARSTGGYWLWSSNGMTWTVSAASGSTPAGTGSWTGTGNADPVLASSGSYSANSPATGTMTLSRN